MISISAVVIAKNEESTISDCLKSISFCDEIIVIDNDSIDKTVEISKKNKARVLSVKEKDFSLLRNKGLEHAQGEWVLYVDADERVSEELKNEINQAIKSSSNNVAYKIMRTNFYFGSFEWPKKENLERLFKKENLKGWHGKVHESPLVEGEIGFLSSPLFHYTHRDLSSMLHKTIEWSDIEAKLRFDHHHPSMSWWRFPRVMITAFIDSYIVQGGWKVGTAGLIESIYQAFSMFVTYAKLWELQQMEK